MKGCMVGFESHGLDPIERITKDGHNQARAVIHRLGFIVVVVVKEGLKKVFGSHQIAMDLDR